MRIAYISFEYPPDSAHGGIATYVAQAARMMVGRGHDVEVFAASPTRQETVSSDGVIEHWLQATDPDVFAEAAGKAFAERHSAHPFDVLEGPEYRAEARVAVALVPTVPFVVKMHTPSVVITQLNTDHRSKSRVRFAAWRRAAFGSVAVRKALTPLTRYLRHQDDCHALFRLERTHTLRADVVAPPCSDLCDFAVDYWNVPKEAVRLAPHPYSPSAQYLAVPPASQGNVIGFVGRLERRKGIDVFAAALPRILSAAPKARVRFIGQPLQHSSGVLYDEWLRRELRPFSPRIEFAGKVSLDDMHHAYADLDVCVLPSLWENFPNVCLEAMAAGRAIVASRGGGMRDMLGNGDCGRVIPAGSSEALARAVLSLLHAPDERQRLGQMARARVLAVYNRDTVGGNMEDIYRYAAERARSRLAVSRL